MDSLNPENPPIETVSNPRRVWKFWGTVSWGLFVFAAMLIGQVVVVLLFVLEQKEATSIMDAIRVAASKGSTISLSVITGLPAVLLALWIAIRPTGTSFADYLGLRWASWKDFLIGIVGLVVLVMGWDLLSRTTGRVVAPNFMIGVVTSAQAEGMLGMLFVAFCVAAPISEEFFARGFLYRGWSESFLKVPGAIVLSALVWTALHLQYNWYFFGEVFTLGLWFGYLRYRSGSTWLTIILHGLNNLAAVLQTMWLAGHS